jgi:hypothetical protein
MHWGKVIKRGANGAEEEQESRVELAGGVAVNRDRPLDPKAGNEGSAE